MRINGMLPLFIAVVLAILVPYAAAEEEKPEPSRKIVYKNIGDVSLSLHLFEPEGHSPEDSAPAIVFFFGGGWTGGSPTQFYPHCAYFAARGMVAAAAEYRIKSLHGTSPAECVKDGKSAVRWLRAHAGELGIDPDRIVAGGGSAGGHVAACTGTIEGFEEAGEDVAISSCPQAMVLFNPVLDVATNERFLDRFGDLAKALSPQQHINEGTPPTIIFHGTADTTVPFAQATAFCDAMKEKGLVCKVVPFEGKGHGFFNYSRDREAYQKTIREADAFLVAQGLLPAAPDSPGE
ncbi:alpha/beta hydrolase fold domain-containing protein [Roseovarius pacificus]|uniref:alpha/beta hydrolase n=1 Tax=Roseovarius pacificus TaxID=337701 RepID=UPI002A18E15F|nr:alpha/beta hydrolase fold domain-containing protein [Roseovarius pacificus]